MKKMITIWLLVFFTLSSYSQEEDKADLPYYSLSISSGIEVPLDSTFDLFRLGMNVNLENKLSIPKLSWLQAGADLSYSLLPVQAETSLSLIGLLIGPLFHLEFTPRFVMDLSLKGGGYYGFFNQILLDNQGLAYENQQGGGFAISAGGKLSFYLSPQLSLGINGEYINYLGLTHGFRAGVKLALHLDGFQQKVQYDQIEFDNIFPSQYKHYSIRSPGSVSFYNEERFPAQDVSVSVYVDQFMDQPSITKGPESLLPGENFQVDPTLLFSNEILSLEEVEKVSALVSVDYFINGRLRQKTAIVPLTIQNRNAVTWDDDRKAAAFVSPKDPEILRFSKGVAGLVRELGPGTIDMNMRMAIGMSEAMNSYGLSYVIDPNTLPYEDAAQNIHAVDFLQYPQETLFYRGGDCDDLSILYSSLLESIGIQTAFITVPGHIFTAFQLDMSPSEVRSFYSNREELIIGEEEVWVPIEATLISKGFSEAWASGAKQWNEFAEKGQARLIPMSDSWREFESSGSPQLQKDLALPDLLEIENSYIDELSRFVERELGPKVQELERKIASRSNNTGLKNRLGLLYARYGLTDNAIEIFEQILMNENFLPAMINLGNIYFLNKDYDRALSLFERAESRDNNNPTVLLCLAKVHYEFSNTSEVSSYFARASRQKPELHEQFAYLSDQADETMMRAEDVERSKESILWFDTEEVF